MDAHKLQLKIFVTPDAARTSEPEAFIPIFHRWVRDHVLPELVIDVANYAHVPKGPGVVLIGHATDYSMDWGEGRPGLLCNRKRDAVAPEERVADLFRRTLHAAVLLEREPTLAGKLRFATNDMLFRVNDRLAAGAHDATFARVKPELEEVAKRVFAGPVTLSPAGGPKDLFSVRLSTAESAPLTALLERL